MNKRIISREEIRKELIEGMKEIAGVVKRTLGPGGNIILMERIGQSLDGSPLSPRITKDGVSVAQECASPDPVKDLVIQTVKAICKKTNSVAGDGTTTAIVLGEAILLETLKELEKDTDLNPQLVKESIEKASKEVIEELHKLATPIKNNTMIKQVATISANGDSEIGEVIGNAFNHVGAEGVVTVDEGHTSHITLDIVDGYQFNRGAEAQDSFFNNKDLTQFEAENVRLIIYDGKLLNYTDLITALTSLIEQSKNNGSKSIPPVVVIANEFSREVINWMLIQKTDAGMVICPVRGPHQTNVRTGYYQDIAVMSGGTRMGGGSRSLNNFDREDAGVVSKVVITKYSTTLYDGQGHEDDILSRVDQLKSMKEKAESPYDAQILGDRLAALTNGIAKIGVGGVTDLEIKEKYDRIEDALNASRAAISEGIVPGGGTTLLRIAESLKNKKDIGSKILKRALKYPFLQILENIGKEKLTKEILKDIINDESLVYDARNSCIVDSLSVGIIDPVKVTRTALENAVSIASLLSTTGGGIIFVNNK